MEKWLSPRDSKETRTCFSCGLYKIRAKFYNWYPHPALLGILGNKLTGIICSKCARREAGSKYWKEMEDERR
tara:strand:+ start:209 stop:424 length:216 start_codon:yes stop_codon:yes gene_type:complete